MLTVLLLPIALALSALPSTFANPIVARAVPAGFSITSISSSGTGCPAGSASYAVDAGGTALSIIFSEFSAEVGPSIPVSSGTKSCTFNFAMTIPSGFRFTLEGIDYRAFYELDPQVKASRKTSYFFSGSSGTGTANTEVTGLSGGFSQFDTFDQDVSSPCGGSATLNVVSTISATNTANPSGSGFVAIDSIDSNAAADTRFRWEAC